MTLRIHFMKQPVMSWLANSHPHPGCVIPDKSGWKFMRFQATWIATLGGWKTNQFISLRLQLVGPDPPLHQLDDPTRSSGDPSWWCTKLLLAKLTKFLAHLTCPQTSLKYEGPFLWAVKLLVMFNTPWIMVMAGQPGPPLTPPRNKGFEKGLLLRP